MLERLEIIQRGGEVLAVRALHRVESGRPTMVPKYRLGSPDPMYIAVGMETELQEELIEYPSEEEVNKWMSLARSITVSWM
jgi:hypothetical protein